MIGFEPMTDGLRNRCSTAELHWLERTPGRLLPMVRLRCRRADLRENLRGNRGECNRQTVFKVGDLVSEGVKAAGRWRRIQVYRLPIARSLF